MELEMVLSQIDKIEHFPCCQTNERDMHRQRQGTDVADVVRYHTSSAAVSLFLMTRKGHLQIPHLVLRLGRWRRQSGFVDLALESLLFSGVGLGLFSHGEIVGSAEEEEGLAGLAGLLAVEE